MNSIDPFVDWDAAYVLGSLSGAERREYERHLVECDACSTAVAELAGLPGLLAKVPATEADELLTRSPEIPMPPTLLPRLVRSARRRSRRARTLVAAGIVAAAAAAAIIVMVLPTAFPAGVSPRPSPSGVSTVVALKQVVPNPLSASVRLTSEGWGTRIEMNCSYGPPPNGGAKPTWAPGSAVGYALYVTDSTGNASEVASWTAAPGTTVEPSGTTSLALADISRVDIRSTSGAVLLAAAP
jgi:hypothetical protein